ncbi:MAG: iron-containing alcohol dehydrogenase, partial [Desulfobulbaceae bacterium]|nr:iron-containing alcohol dehydrogenase [Desulfobulbaceae bacterium]
IGNPEKFAVIAELMGMNVENMSLREAAEAAVEAVYNLNQDVGIPATLTELKIPSKKIKEMAKIALTVTRPVENNPRKPTLEDVMSIYETAFAGWGHQH